MPNPYDDPDAQYPDGDQTTYNDGRTPGSNAYPNYINSNTNRDGLSDEAYEEMRRMGPNDRLLGANDAMHDEGVKTTPLDVLIPKMASGTATKAEKMQFYNLTGRGM